MRKAYGGAYITMNSRDLGADLVLSWPGAEMGIMSARAAVGIVNRRQLAAAPDSDRQRAMLADTYAAEHLHADVAAAGGFVDELVAPADTRWRLAGALRALARSHA
jgi:acetyl-CoA carboxylase carboxyltransferase component